MRTNNQPTPEQMKEYRETMKERNTQSKKVKFDMFFKMLAGAIILTIILSCYIGLKSFTVNTYNSGRTQGQLDIINETTQTGTIFYLMNTSDAKSINSTSISKIQQDFLTSCIKAGVCTFNQTKYNELMRGQ
jgi:hypothetical protein